MSQRFRIEAWHGEGPSVWYVMDYGAGVYPYMVRSFPSRAAAVRHAEELHAAAVRRRREAEKAQRQANVCPKK